MVPVPASPDAGIAPAFLAARQEADACLWPNDDAAGYRPGRAVLAGEHAWLERGGVPLGVTVEDLRPRDPVKAKPAGEGAPARQPAAVG